ncbi:MAG: CotH kinase family protein [Treponema sp.]|jgi:hypothetical protein|nr:CotH kinase family protein [Treponema sp.]
MKRVFFFAFTLVVSFIISGCDRLTATVEDLMMLENWDEPQGYVNPDDLNTGLPIVRINTVNGKDITNKVDYLTADIKITDPDDSDNDLTTTTEIRGRGNSSWWNNGKKPYRLKFFEKQKLFGLTKAKSWVLLANATDDTMIRNIIAFEMGEKFGLPFTNHYVPVELILNGKYRGSYLLTEQVQVGKGRVDIDEDTGYLIELDNYYDEEPKFKTAPVPFPVMIKSPETIPNGFGDNFVKTSTNELVGKMFADSFPENGYRDLINMDTFVDYIMIQEFLNNTDFWSLNSVYLYKDGEPGSKICAGPLWDMDRTLGNPHKRRPANSDITPLGEVFFGRLFADPVFVAAYKAKWNEHYDIIATEMPAFIDEMADKLAQSEKMNYLLWQGTEPEDSYYEGIIDDLKTWWGERVAFMNGAING